MSDPKRWLDEESDGAPRTRELLRSGLAMDPPPGAQDEVWAALSGKIGALGGGGGGGTPNGAGPSAPTTPATGTAGAAGSSAAAGKVAGIAGAAAGKAALLGFAGATLLGGLLYGALSGAPSSSISPERPKEPAIAFVATTEAPALPPARTTADVPLVEPSPARLEAPSVSGAPRPKPSAAPKEHAAAASSVDSAAASAEKASQLREENRSLGEAREALRGGNASAALEKLDALAGRFPDGTLAQEREALAIEALYRAGHRDAAKARAEAFLRAHPTSLHATKVRGFLQ